MLTLDSEWYDGYKGKATRAKLNLACVLGLIWLINLSGIQSSSLLGLMQHGVDREEKTYASIFSFTSIWFRRNLLASVFCFFGRNPNPFSCSLIKIASQLLMIYLDLDAPLSLSSHLHMQLIMMTMEDRDVLRFGPSIITLFSKKNACDYATPGYLYFFFGNGF